MIYSSACEYAIRAMVFLAARHEEGEERVKLKDIARAEELPSPFLSSILQRLVMEGILRSQRGPTGGYSLEYPPDEITLFHIKAAVDGTREFEECAVGLTTCSDRTPCPLHDSWKPIRERIRSYLEKTTLADMAASVQAKQEKNAR